MSTGHSFLQAHGVPELLAPAGGPEPFNAALAAGADAIYCGLGNDFNARRGARNFTDETFRAACRSAHLAGARVYVTMNVAVSTDELPRVLELARRAWVLGADALIIQDWASARPRSGAPGRRSRPMCSTQAKRDMTARGVDMVVVPWAVHSRDALAASSRCPEIGQPASPTEGCRAGSALGYGALCFCYSGVCMIALRSPAGRSATAACCAPALPPSRTTCVDEDGTVGGLGASRRTRPACPQGLLHHLTDLRRAAGCGRGPSLQGGGAHEGP